MPQYSNDVALRGLVTLNLPALVMLSRFFRSFPIVACNVALQEKILADTEGYGFEVNEPQ